MFYRSVVLISRYCWQCKSGLKGSSCILLFVICVDLTCLESDDSIYCSWDLCRHRFDRLFFNPVVCNSVCNDDLKIRLELELNVEYFWFVSARVHVFHCHIETDCDRWHYFRFSSRKSWGISNKLLSPIGKFVHRNTWKQLLRSGFYPVYLYH